jgi:hypothetical protein
MAVPPTTELQRICSSPDFAAFTDQIKREFQVSVTPNFRSLVNSGVNVGENISEYSFKFRCQRSNSDFLVSAREMLEQYLINHNIRVYPSPTVHIHKRGDSFAEAFPHFDSKVLSTTKTRGKAKIFFDYH